MNKDEKIELVKKCFIGTTEIDAEDWDEMVKEEGDGLKEFLSAVCLAMDMQFNSQATDLLRFIRNGYRPQAPNLREWYDEKRKVVINEDGLLIAFGLSQNIKTLLSKTPMEKSNNKKPKK